MVRSLMPVSKRNAAKRLRPRGGLSLGSRMATVPPRPARAKGEGLDELTPDERAYFDSYSKALSRY